MANDILITPLDGTILFQTPTTGSSNITLTTLTGGTGGTIALITYSGVAGDLFSISDSLTGSLMSVSDVSGIPILEVFSNDSIIMGEFGTDALVVSGDSVGFGTTTPTAPVDIYGASNELKLSYNTGQYSSLSTDSLGILTIDAVSSGATAEISIKTDSTEAIGIDTDQKATFSAQIKADIGTVSTPSYSFSAYPTTGIYSSGANQIGFVTSGALRWSLNSNGYLIGGAGVLLRLGVKANPDPSGTNAEIYYNTTNHNYRVYQNSTWETLATLTDVFPSGATYWKTTGTTNVTYPTISGETHFDGGVTGDSYFFGDGDTGFWESADDVLRLNLGNSTSQVSFTATAVRFGDGSNDARILMNAGDTVPAYGFDTNVMGMGRSATNEITFYTNSTAAVVIDASQHVSIYSGLTLTQQPTSGSSVQVLTRNSSSGVIEYTTIAGAGTPALSGLTDVNITTPADTVPLIWDSSSERWIDATSVFITTGKVTASTFEGSTFTHSNSNYRLLLNTTAGGAANRTLLESVNGHVLQVNESDILIIDGSGNSTFNGNVTVTGDTYISGSTTIASELTLVTTPTSGASTQVLTRNTSTGVIEYSTISGDAPSSYGTLSDSATITYDFNSNYFATKALSATTTAITLNLENVIAGSNQILTVVKNTASDVVITLSGSSGLNFYGYTADVDYETTPEVTLSGASGNIFDLSFLARTATCIGVAIGDIDGAGSGGGGSVTNVATTAPITGGPITSTGTIGISQATTSTCGYLSDTDWNTFDGKTTCVGTVTSVGTNSPLTGTVTTSGNLSIQVANTSQSGYLTNTDWNTFDGKTTCVGTVTTASGTNNELAVYTSATAISGNTNLTYDGITLCVANSSASGRPFELVNTNTSNASGTFKSTTNSNNASESFSLFSGRRDQMNTAGAGATIMFSLDDSGNNETEYGGMGASIVTNTAASEDGQLNFYVTSGGATRTKRMELSPEGYLKLCVQPPAGAVSDRILMWDNVAGEIQSIAGSSYTSCVGTVTSVGTTSPLTGTVTGSGNLAIQVANTSQSGYLTNTDWNTFDGKTTCTGTVTAANGVDNRIATFSSATALNGEANLLFDGTTMEINGNVGITGTTVFGDDITLLTLPSTGTSSQTLIRNESTGVIEYSTAVSFDVAKRESSGLQSITGTWTSIPLTTEVIAGTGILWSSGFTSRLTVGVDGTYWVGGAITFRASATQRAQHVVGIHVNGVLVGYNRGNDYIRNSGNAWDYGVVEVANTPLVLTGGSYVEFFVATVIAGTYTPVTVTGSVLEGARSEVWVSNASGIPGIQGAQGNDGSFTATSGTVNGITLTDDGSTVILGGTLAINNTDWSGTDLSVANGGTGLSTVATNTILTGNGTGALTAETNLTFDTTNGLDVNGGATNGIQLTVGQGVGGADRFQFFGNGVVRAQTQNVWEPYDYSSADHHFNVGHASVGQFEYHFNAGTGTMNADTIYMALSRTELTLDNVDLRLCQAPTSGSSDQVLIRNVSTGEVEYVSKASLGGGTVTNVSPNNTNHLTIATQSTTPVITVVTAAVADAGTGLADGNQIYDFVIGLNYVANATTCVGTVTSVGTTSPLTGTVTGSGNLAIQVANTSQSGYLTNTDWNTFDGKTSCTGTIDGTMVSTRIPYGLDSNSLQTSTGFTFSANTTCSKFVIGRAANQRYQFCNTDTFAQFLMYDTGNDSTVSIFGNTSGGYLSVNDAGGGLGARWSGLGDSYIGNGFGLAIGSGSSGTGAGVSLDISGSCDSIAIAKGSTGQQPTGSQGMMRFDTSLDKYRVTTGTTSWQNIATEAWVNENAGGGSQTPWTSNIDAAGFYVQDLASIRDNNLNEVLTFTGETSSVNYIEVSGTATAVYPKFCARGEANIGLVFHDSNDNVLFQLSPGTASCNYLNLTSNNTNNPVRLFAAGTDANIDICMVPKGARTVTVPTGYEANVSADNDLVNKKWVDDQGFGAGSGTVTSSNTPANNEIAVFTTGTDIEGQAGFTYDSTTGFMNMGSSSDFAGIYSDSNLIARYNDLSGDLEYANKSIISDGTAGNVIISGTTTGGRLHVCQSTGSSPFVVASTTVVTNLNADTVDAVHVTSLLRSDVADTKTVGDLTFSDGVCAEFGNLVTTGDLSIWHGGSNSYVCNRTGIMYLKGNNVSCVCATGVMNIQGSVVNLCHAAAKQLQTATHGICLAGTKCGCATDWVASSDCRVKTNVVDIEDPIEITMGLCGVCYTRLDTKELDDIHLGFLAQDVEKVLPEVVTTGEVLTDSEFSDLYKSLEMKEFYGIKYDKIIPVLVEAFKAQRNEFLELKQEFEDYKKNNTL